MARRGRRKLEDRNIRKLTRLGGHSLGVTIPIDMTRALGWRERQKVVIARRGKRLTIEDWPVRRSRSKGGKRGRKGV